MRSHDIRSEDLPQITELLQQLSTLAKNYKIYGADHPRSKECMEAYLAQRELVTTLPGVDRRIVIAYHDQRFYLEHIPLPESRRKGHVICDHLDVNGMAGFQLVLRLPDGELDSVLTLLGAKPSRRKGEIAESTPGFMWLAPDAVHRLESSVRTPGKRSHMLLELQELRVNENLYVAAFESLSSFMDDCFEGRTEDTSRLNDVAKHLVSSFMDNGDDSILPLTTIPYHDNFTYYHSLNVTILMVRAASLVIKDEEQLRRIGQAALLHDLGKVDVPQEILYKAGRLTEAEAKIVMTHPVTGARRLAAFPDSDPLAVMVAFGHHIKDDGRGYPNVSQNYKLDPITALLEVADIFEALTAFRPYKSALTAAAAFEILYSMPHMSSFRPYMDLMVRSIGFNPVGSRVRTADGELGIVTGHVNNDPTQPIVRTIHGEGGVHASLDPERTMQNVSSPEQHTSENSIVAIDPEEDLAIA